MTHGRLLLALAAALGCGAASAGSGAGWTELPWPWPRDAWPAGRAFQCAAASCGGSFAVFMRAKRGLCSNCATGVTEDSEVDGVADLDMMSDDFVPAADGVPVAFGAMGGRSRAYRLVLPGGERRPAVGYVVSRRPECDLLVVASEGQDADTDAARQAVIALMDEPDIVRWVTAQLDGR